MSTESFVLQVCGWLIGVPIEVLLIAALLRGAYKQFPFVLAYAAANLVTTLIEIPASVRFFYTQDPDVAVRFARTYWWDERVLLVLIFALVISLIDQAMAQTRSRRIVRTGLIVGAILFAGISFLIHNGPRMGRAMTLTTRDMNFGATILDLGLWGLLIASRHKDRRLLLISGALGLQFTGEAIGQSIRDLSLAQQSHAVSLTGSLIVMLADLACLYIWWQTFRGRESQKRKEPR
jgi:hypothetical protein